LVTARGGKTLPCRQEEKKGKMAPEIRKDRRSEIARERRPPSIEEWSGEEGEGVQLQEVRGGHRPKRKVWTLKILWNPKGGEGQKGARERTAQEN